MEPEENLPYIDHPYEISDNPLSANLKDFDAKISEMLLHKLKN